MARRSSNRSRLERLRDEAEIRSDERDAKERSERNAGRLMAVWAVKNGMGEVIAVYPYPRKADAEKEAERLRAVERATFIVAPHKVPFEG
ncbi:MAG: hypothetical protein AAGD14_15390 [Planctomycetota bacterium]